MASLSDVRVRNFLLHGTRTGKVAWVAADGAPHVAPIWFVIDGDDIVFNTGSDTGKGRALAREGRASLVVDDGERNGVPGELVVRLHPSKITAAFDIAD